MVLKMIVTEALEDTLVPEHDGDGPLMFVLIKTVHLVGVINDEI